MIENDGASDGSAFNDDELPASTAQRQIAYTPIPKQTNGLPILEEDPGTPHNTPFGARELSPSQHVAIAAIVAGHTYTDVCKALGIDRKTLYAWRQQPRFAAELEAEVRALRQSARVRLSVLADLALDALRDVLQSHPKDAVVVSAARFVLDRLDLDPCSDERESTPDSGNRYFGTRTD
jgi:transposase-like protein